MIKLKPILMGLILICFMTTLPVLAASDEDTQLQITDNAGTPSNSENKVSTSGSGASFFNIDTSNYDIVDLLFNPSAGIQIFKQITPLSMASIILSAIIMTGVIILVVLAFFLSLGKIGLGTLHWDAKKGWHMIEHNKAAMIVLFFAVLGTFLFSALTIFMYQFGFKMLGGIA